MSKTDDIESQRALIAALAESLGRMHGPVSLFETHISWVLVAGEFAYKFKKAVRFDFVDFGTLAARRFYGMEEVRLNRRLAPGIYLDVLAVAGTTGHPRLVDPSAAAGDAIEYCVHMRAFPQEALWSYRLPRRLVEGSEIDDLADGIARFHLSSACAPADARFGGPALLEAIAQDNYAQIDAAVHGADRPLAQTIRDWGEREQIRLAPLFAKRKRDGYVRECHGDLHSGNILTLDGKAQAFDCIEFNDGLRWIDVIEDIAFIYMDLRFQGRQELAARFLNRYLESGGDYEGVRVLRYYQVQRALVRCKVGLLRMRQTGGAEGAAAIGRDALRYLEYAVKNTVAATASIMITHGFSGSGKTAFARRVVECTGALQLRSDVERKRMAGAASSGAISGTGCGMAQAAAPIGAGLYGAQQTECTYGRLLALSRALVQEGMPVVVDAAFLQRAQRRQFQTLADELGVPFVIFDLRASEPTMRSRVVRRQAAAQDASDAGVEVLQYQLQNHEPLSGEELHRVVPVDAETGMEHIDVPALCESAGLRRHD